MSPCDGASIRPGGVEHDGFLVLVPLRSIPSRQAVAATAFIAVVIGALLQQFGEILVRGGVDRRHPQLHRLVAHIERGGEWSAPASPASA